MYRIVLPAIFLCVFMLNLATTIVSAGEFSEIAAKRFERGITESPKQLDFTEGMDRIFFSARKINKSAVQFVIAHNSLQNKVYGTVVQHEKYGSVRQIYNEKSGRYFYLVTLCKYPDGGFDFTKVMGFDPSSKKWKTYVDANDYYHPKGYDDGIIMINKAGDLQLNFKRDGEFGFRIQTQKYILHWNDATQKFDYVDDGFGENY